jgi:hypothetical protein
VDFVGGDEVVLVEAARGLAGVAAGVVVHEFQDLLDHGLHLGRLEQAQAIEEIRLGLAVAPRLVGGL